MRTAEECLDVIADAYNCPDVAITEAIQMILDEAVAHGMTIAAEICKARVTESDFTVEATRCCQKILTSRDNKIWRNTK